MLAVFVGTGVLVTRSVDYQQFSTARVLGTTVVLTLATEVLHEAVHVVALRGYGHRAEVRWRHLAVVPSGGRVPRRELIVAVSTPVVAITVVAATVLSFARGPILVGTAGYVLVVNATVSVLDVGTAIRLLVYPAGSVIDFDAPGATGDGLEPGEVTAGRREPR